ncbi:MAG: ATP-binding protein [Verrucomicrobiaceae bacterium]|nr:ATP-binding protein [Verrucomicrobiaceae bacterium]
MNTHINRYLAERIRDVSRSFPVVLLTGARQTGKTTLLKEVFPDAPFFTLDLPSVAHEAENNGAGLLDAVKDHPTIILDEVQYAPGLFRHIKVAVDADRHRMGRFVMTGSQKFALMKNVSESLAGRCVILEVDTLASTEYADSNRFTFPPLADFIWRGGYPELWRMPEMPVREFYASYLATYLERDVRQLINVVNLRDFERFIRFCATYSGNLVNFAKLGGDVGVAATTIKHWISVLEASNIIHLLPPFFNNYGKRLIRTPKMYFKDTGLLCFLLGISSPEQMVTSPFIGGIWETFVLGQMQRAIQAERSPAEIYFWRDAQGVEVDFVLWLNGRLQLIEAKWSENGDETKHLTGMNAVRSVLGQNAAESHLIVCRTPFNHWHSHDPAVRVVNGQTYRDWFHPAAPVAGVLREDAAEYMAKPRKTARKRAAKRKTKSSV